MIVVVGGIKGGSGKTTLATNLAVMRSINKKVLLVDADEQKSTSDWAGQRASIEIPSEITTIQLSGKFVHGEIKKLKHYYDDVIVDVGGRDTTSQRSAMTVANIFLVPFKPRSLDIWTLGPLNTMISEIRTVNQKLKCLAVINQADSRGTDNKDALEVLKECTELQCIPFSIGNRKAFGNAAAEGLATHELKIQDKKANEEMKMLYDYIFT